MPPRRRAATRLALGALLAAALCLVAVTWSTGGGPGGAAAGRGAAWVARWVSHIARPFVGGTRPRVADSAHRLLNQAMPRDVDAEVACAAYGFKARARGGAGAEEAAKGDSDNAAAAATAAAAASASAVPVVFDAVLFANEFDLLEIRMHELADVVDHFIVVEGDASFTGRPKPRALHNAVADLAAGGNGSAFAGGRDMRWMNPFLPRLHLVALAVAVHVPGAGAAGAPSTTVNPWHIEGMHRQAFASALADLGAAPGDLAIVADLDEIPRAAAVRILRDCQVPDVYFPVRLEMRFYYYSFEWEVPGARWIVATVNRIDEQSRRLWFTRRSLPEHTIFYDAGWHCSWCFPRIADFLVKMASYAHTEHNQPEFRDPVRIQAYVCDGFDLFDRLPEGHTVEEVIQQGTGGLMRQTSLIGAPEHLARHGATRFGHLLPGHCVREDAPPGFKDARVG